MQAFPARKLLISSNFLSGAPLLFPTDLEYIVGILLARNLCEWTHARGLLDVINIQRPVTDAVSITYWERNIHIAKEKHRQEDRLILTPVWKYIPIPGEPTNKPYLWKSKPSYQYTLASV